MGVDTDSILKYISVQVAGHGCGYGPAGPLLRQEGGLCWEGLTSPVSLGERLRILKEKGPGAIPDPSPMLAEGWDIEKGGSRYVFHLKKGVKFHNGKEFSAEDVKWTLERIKDPVHISLARIFITKFIESIETPDRYTVAVNLTQPYSAFLRACSWHQTAILPKDIVPWGSLWAKSNKFNPPTPAPPGTGPFRITEFKQKQQAVFERFEDYRVPGLPYLDKIIYKVIPKVVPRTVALRAHNVDYAIGVDANWLSEIIKGKDINKPFLYAKDDLYVLPTIGTGTNFIHLNCHDQSDTPFKDVRVRQALDYAIDKERLVKTLYGDLGIPMAQKFHPDISAWGFRDIKHRERNIDKAKQLLKEAGYPNGLDVEFKISPIYSRNDLMVQIVQQMVKPAGFRLKIDPKMGVQYWSGLTKMNYQMAASGYGSGGDPMQNYYPLLHTDPGWKGYAWRTGVKDPVLDDLLDEVSRATDLTKRRAALKTVIQRANDQVYLLTYMKTIGASAWSTKLKNFKPLDYFYPTQAFAETWLES